MKSLQLRLPATSANLGAAFDSAAVALGLYLDIEAQAAEEFSIAATGRDADQCNRLEGNLILDTYRELLHREGRTPVPLAIRMENQIPLGMGCGSSAAGRLVAVSLANRFGELGWDSARILAEASLFEGHPDNAAACWLGGMVVSAGEGATVHVARVDPPPAWRALLVLPKDSLATSTARAVLPTHYSREDAVSNIQAASLLGLAFAQAREDLLRPAMADRIHQPYRSRICSLLPLLLPLAGSNGILGVALSGAGPSVLLILSGEEVVTEAAAIVRSVLSTEKEAEILAVSFESRGAERFLFLT